jgi:uncharacterized caspase-like protein
MDVPTGTLIAYATKSGSVTPDDSLFTQELLRFMRVPGLEVQEVFKRVRASVLELTKAQERMPWVETSLVGEFYFKPQPSPSPTPAVSPDELLEIIKSEQRSKVKESRGKFEGENFSDEDFKRVMTR